MRNNVACGTVVFVLLSFGIHVCAQDSRRSSSPAPLVLTGAIPLPDVKGRIDHFGFDPTHNRLFVSVFGWEASPSIYVPLAIRHLGTLWMILFVTPPSIWDVGGATRACDCGH